MQEHNKGLLIALAGVLILSPDTLVIRLINLDSWTFIYWRNLYSALFYCLLIAIFHHKNLTTPFRRFSRANLFTSSMYAISAATFVIGISLTSVVNTLVIFSTSPFFSALLSRIFLKESVALKTWIAIAMVFICVFSIISESFQLGNMAGDLSALVSAIALSSALVSSRKKNNSNILVIMLFSSVLVSAFALFFYEMKTVTNQQMLLTALDGLIIALSFALISTAPKFIPAAEVSLMMALEVVIGSFLVWYFIGEEPTQTALIGGIGVISILIIHSYLNMGRLKGKLIK